jgi:hypothetical protein
MSINKEQNLLIEEMEATLLFSYLPVRPLLFGHCEHLKGAWQSLGLGVCYERKGEIPLRDCFVATFLAMTKRSRLHIFSGAVMPMRQSTLAKAI